MKSWKYQRWLGLYNLFENQCWVKTSERLNSVFRNSAWQHLERQSATEFGQRAQSSKYLQHTVFPVYSQILGGIVVVTVIRVRKQEKYSQTLQFPLVTKYCHSFRTQNVTGSGLGSRIMKHSPEATLQWSPCFFAVICAREVIISALKCNILSIFIDFKFQLSSLVFYQ